MFRGRVCMCVCGSQGEYVCLYACGMHAKLQNQGTFCAVIVYIYIL
jgi:hypothetical protein